MMIPSDRPEAIQSKLRQIAEERDVTILYACESGSRAWGIASPDSDWDVRFIYVHERHWYLSIHERSDTIEVMDGDLDFAGWDLRKALRLAYKSNPSLLEWLNSPIIYDNRAHFQERLKNVLRSYSARSLMHHYVSLASRQVKAYWKEGQPVTLKKYLYAVRPVMAVDYMASHAYAVPPIFFGDLLYDSALSTDEERELRALLAMKAHTSEIGGKGRFPALDAYITEGIERGRKLAEAAPSGNICRDALDVMFQDLLMAW
jgi:hypothetical protein